MQNPELETWLRDEFRRAAGEDARVDVPIQVKGEIAGKKARFCNIPALTSGGPRHELFRASMKFLIEIWSAILPETQDIKGAIARAQQKMTEGDELLAIGRMVGVKDKKVIWGMCRLAFCQRFPEFRRRLGCPSNFTKSLCTLVGMANAVSSLALSLVGPARKTADSVMIKPLWDGMVADQQMFLDNNLVVLIQGTAPIIAHVPGLASAPLARDCSDGRFPFPFLDHFKTLFQERPPTQEELDDVRRWYEYEYEMDL